jgi:hypothetical protein
MQPKQINWKEAIDNSEKQDILCKSQFGSCRAKLSQISILIEILQHDLSRITRKQYGQIIYVAKACYNCILPNQEFIISGKFGAHDNTVRMPHNPLKHSQYHFAVARSQKELILCHSQNQPIYGTC